MEPKEDAEGGHGKDEIPNAQEEAEVADVQPPKKRATHLCSHAVSFNHPKESPARRAAQPERRRYMQDAGAGLRRKRKSPVDSEDSEEPAGLDCQTNCDR